MDIHLYYTGDSFKVCSDEDAEKKSKLKIGSVYKARITVVRNYAFHRKYFKMISVAWEFLNERKQAFFGDVESFRKTVEVAAGHCDRVYNLSLRGWVEVPKTVSFSGMDDIAFRELYEKVREVLLSVFLKDVKEEQFERILLDF